MSDPEKSQAPINPDAATAEAKKPAAKKSTGKITVIGPAAGRWRAGRKFGAEPVEIALADLSQDQLAALQGDAALMCTIS